MLWLYTQRRTLEVKDILLKYKMCNTFHPLLYNYTGCIYCTSYVILLPFNIYLYTSCPLHSFALFVLFSVHSSCIQPFLPVYISQTVVLLCCIVLCCVVLYILCKYTESHLIWSQIPCLCKLTWPINVILILILIFLSGGLLQESLQ